MEARRSVHLSDGKTVSLCHCPRPHSQLVAELGFEPGLSHPEPSVCSFCSLASPVDLPVWGGLLPVQLTSAGTWGRCTNAVAHLQCTRH